MPALKRKSKTPRRPRRTLVSSTAKRRVGLILGMTALATLGLGGGWFVFTGGAGKLVHQALETAKHETLQFSARMGLRVGHVLVIGRKRVAHERINRALGVRHGAAIMGFDPKRAKARLEKLPWVRAATVERRLPDTLYIRLAERTPLALWQYKGRLALIDHEGVVITRRGLGSWRHLPMVVGKDAAKHAEAMIRIMETYPELGQLLHAAVRVSNRRWDLKFSNGITVRLPEKNTARAVTTLARLAARERILERDIILIDLRLPDRLVVRATPRGKGTQKKQPAPATERRRPSKDT